MALFVLIALSVYTLMHLVVYWGIRPLLTGSVPLALAVIAWMALMIGAPIVVRLVERAGYESFARVWAWIGFSWMGFVFLAFSGFLLLGAWEVLALLLGKGLPRLPALSLYGPRMADVVVVFVVVIGCYGLFEARQIRVGTVALETDRLATGRDRLRIVQVSDIHLGLMNRQARLAPIVARIRDLAPDLVVATGDVVDAQINHLDGLSELWKQINPPLGKFAVIGNHETYAGLPQSLDFLGRSGFTVLRNEAAVLGSNLVLVGVDDDSVPGPPADEAGLLARYETGRYTVLLKHRPRVKESAAGLFDLQLSGHAHRGQIFPFNFLTGLEYPLQDGLYDLAERGIAPRGYLYASRGTGTWGPPMRVLSPPEIAVFDVERRQPGR